MSVSRNQKIQLPILDQLHIELQIKREDMLHPYISGNKFRKLKYNLIEAKERNYNSLLTFGGAFSNHIAAVAAAGREKGFKTIGVIRGEELHNKVEKNPTLSFARDCGMKLEFVSRTIYRNKEKEELYEYLREKFGSFYLIPEGGTNELAVKGCQEILTEADITFDYICCSVGTGGTISGLINCSQPSQQVLGFPALKGDFLKGDIRKFVRKENWSFVTDYHFGGYAKINNELVNFINLFREETGILLDPIYTGKMMYGIMDMIEKGYFNRESRILVIHTGGLQGIKGMNLQLKKKNAPLIIE